MKEHHSLLLTSPLRRKSWGIIQAGVLKPQVTTTLQWLKLPPEPRNHNRCPSHPVFLPGGNPLKKFIHLIHILSSSISLVTLLQRSKCPFRKSRSMIVDIKPLGLPIPSLTAQSKRNILLRHTRTKFEDRHLLPFKYS